MKISRLDEIVERQLKSRDGQVLYSMVRSISDALSLKSLFIHFEELTPGNFSAKPHSHTKKDEVFIISRGEGSLIANGVTQTISEGDIISFEGTDEEVHVIQNTSESPLSDISIATNPLDDTVNYSTEP
jgi:uncharacterized cupin superfamily protein